MQLKQRINILLLDKGFNFHFAGGMATLNKFLVNNFSTNNNSRYQLFMTKTGANIFI